MNINDLSFEEKVGQRFIFGVNNENIDCLISLIKDFRIGGVILYKKNYRSYQEMVEVIKKLKAANKNNKIPLFIAIDQEGGKVNRWPQEIHNLKNIYDVSKTNKELVYDYANIIGMVLKETGINMNLAPVIDIFNNSKTKALYKRCFYGDVDNVSSCGLNYLKGIDNNVISVIKHYPGHGVTKKDSHFIIPYVYNYQDVLDKHIIPFNRLINNNVDALMIGHLIIRRLTGLLPASISNKFIDKYLNNYKGLIITDEINMIKRWPLYQFIYTNKALKSHSDILLVKIKNSDEGYKIFNKYKKIVGNNNEYLDSSVKKILDIKQKYGINDNADYQGMDVEKINALVDYINMKIL